MMPLTLLLIATKLTTLMVVSIQFNSYNVIQIFNKHLEHIDLDDWIVCSSVDAVKLLAYVYGNRKFVKFT